MNLLNIAAVVACSIVAIVLVRGLYNMMQEGSANKSQKLMRLRVVTQAIAVVVIVSVVYLSR